MTEQSDEHRPDALQPEVVAGDDRVDGDLDDFDDLDDEGYEDDDDNPLAALFGGGGDRPGAFDMGSLLDTAMQMQQQMLAAREDAAAQVVEGAAGGGVVKVQVTGGLEFRKVTIDPSAVDPEDPTLLEDLVLAAVRDAVAQANALQADAMGGLGLPGIPGV